MAQLTKTKSGRLNKIKDKKRDITTGVNERIRIISNYYRQCYANKLANLDKMDRFLATYILRKLRHEEMKA